MGLRLKYRNSLVRLAASLVLVLALLAAIVGHIYVSMSYINRLHEYKLNYVTARDEILLDFCQEFSNFGQIKREFFVLYFAGTPVDGLDVHVSNARYSFERLTVISETYLFSLQNDPAFLDVNQTEKSIRKNQINYSLLGVFE